MLQVTKDTLITLTSTATISLGCFVVCGLLAVTICVNDRLMQVSERRAIVR